MLQKARMEDNFKKKQDEVTNEQTAVIIWKCKKLLYL